MTSKKPVVLWCWWYDRKDLLTPLLPVMAEAENHFLFYRFPEQEKLSFDIPGKRHYWTEYSSPYHIIKQISPAKVVFMGIENMLTIALLSACRRKGIQTYYLAHGLTSAYENAVKGEEETDLSKVDRRYSPNQDAYQKKKLHSLLFFFKAAIKATAGEKLFLFRFFISSFRYKGIHERLYKNQSIYRLADKYIVFTRHIARLLEERDGVPASRMTEIGVYTLDSMFKELGSAEGNTYKTDGAYILIIDQPLGSIPEKEQLDFWHNLIQACEELGYKLVVKLHPSNYNKVDYIIHPNCVWWRDEISVESLIRGATACLGFFSALLLPVIITKPTAVFNPLQLPLVNDWINMKVVTQLPYPGVSSALLKNALSRDQSARIDEYERKFLFSADGLATQRFKMELLK